MVVEDWISTMALAYVGIPVFVFVTFQNLLALKVTGLVLTANGLTALIKWLTRDAQSPFLKRPAGAQGCNLQLTGFQGGRPGFPSGHMATTTAFWTCAWYIVPPEYKTATLVAGSALSLAMMWSRMKKSCHTFLQCIVGSILGFGIAYIGMRFL
jgi:membrane-associated phospholipid phosphatase